LSEWTGCALALAVSHATFAQKLHFANDEPKPGSGKIAAKLASEAREQFDALREQSGASAIRDAKQAYLAATGFLLESGDAKGVSGTFLVVAGGALMRERDAVFGMLDAKRLDEGTLRLLASDLALLAQGAPETSAALDRSLRDAFANVLQATAPSGADGASLWPWPESSGLAAPAWPDFARLGAGAESLAALHQRCELAEKWIAFNPGARAMTRLVMDASWPLGREKQISAGVYKRWISELVHGASEVLIEQTGEVGLARLRRLATLGRIFALLDALAPDPGAKQLEKVLIAAVEVMPDEPGANAGWEKLEPWLELAASRTSLMDDKHVVRQLRPGLRSIGDLAKGSQTELFEALVRVANKPDAAGDPGVMAAVNLFSENIELVKVLHRASKAIADPASPAGDPVARENAKPYTDGLLKLAKEVADPKQRDRSLAELRNLATDIGELLELPGEKRLREKDPEIEAILGGKSADVLAIIDRERMVWRKSVGAAVKPGTNSGGEGNAARLHAIGVVLALAVDAAECKAIATDPSDPLQQWGGWWLEDESLQHLAADAANAIPALLKDAEAGQATAVLAAAQSGVREHAVVSLAARFSRGLAAIDPAAPKEIPLRSLRAIATGTPDVHAVAFALWRDKIATICLYVSEGITGSDAAKQFATAKAAECFDALIRNEETAP